MNRFLLSAMMAAGIFLAHGLKAEGQILSPLSDGQHAVYLNQGEDRDGYYAVGYATGDGDVMHITEFERPVDTTTDGWRLKFGGQGSLFEGEVRGWDISTAASLVIKNGRDRIFKGTKFGFDFTELFGYYGAAWFALGEFGYEWFVGYHAALRLGVSIGPVEFNVRIGEDESDLDGDSVSPYFVTAGLNFRFQVH